MSIGADSRDKQAQSIARLRSELKEARKSHIVACCGNNAASVVSVGDAGKERQIVNVGAWVLYLEKSTDAINGSQLYAIAKTLKDDLDASLIRRGR